MLSSFCKSDSLKTIGKAIMAEQSLKKSGFQSKIFEKYPHLQAGFENFLKTVSKEERDDIHKKFLRFIDGEITWSEMKGYPADMLREISKIAYFLFQKKSYKEAEVIFKGLSVIDHRNWYYHAALGAIYQKQKYYEQAIDEYTAALHIKEDEITSLTNRGESYFQLGLEDQALQDFDKAISLDASDKNPWARRAKLLKNKIKKD